MPPRSSSPIAPPRRTICRSFRPCPPAICRLPAGSSKAPGCGPKPSKRVRSRRCPFRYRIFPERARAEFEHFLLRPSGQDYYLAFMRDEFMQSLAAELGMETQAARLAVVFLNGEYWGLHYLREKEDTDFIAYYGHC